MGLRRRARGTAIATVDQPQQLGRTRAQTTGERESWYARNRETAEAWLFILPFLVISMVLQIYPALQAALARSQRLTDQLLAKNELVRTGGDK